MPVRAWDANHLKFLRIDFRKLKNFSFDLYHADRFTFYPLGSVNSCWNGTYAYTAVGIK